MVLIKKSVANKGIIHKNLNGTIFTIKELQHCLQMSHKKRRYERLILTYSIILIGNVFQSKVIMDFVFDVGLLENMNRV